MSGFFFGPEPIIWVQQAFGPAWAPVFRTLTLAGTTWGVILAVGLALWLWGRDAAYPVVGIVALEAAVNLALNQLFHLPRPDAPGIVPYEHVPIASFPSGHVFTATVLWGLLYARGRVPAPLAAAVVGATALSRLYLGVHFVGDVLGGAAFGAALIGVHRRVWPAADRWLRGRSPAFFARLSALAGAASGAGLALLGSNAAGWNAAGALAGAGVALPLEQRLVRGPGERAERQRAALLGVAGMLPLLLVERLSGERAVVVGAATCFLATVWAVLLAPLLAARLGRRKRPMSIAKKALAAAAGALAALLLYGVAVEPHLVLDTQEHEATLPGLPPEWEGREIALLADFQVGMWWANTEMARRAVRQVADRRPAAVLLAGDFIYKPDADPRELVREMTEILRPLAEGGIPTYAVLGNHDWALNRKDGTRNALAARRVREGLEGAGIRVLENEAVPLAAGGPGAPLYLAGIGSRWAGTARPAEALRGIPAGAARVLLMHNPDSFEEIPPGAAPLALAGHTHGGQVALPFLPAWSWLAITTGDEVHADGWARGYGARGNRLYVNRGIGFSTVPLRINCPPEVTYFTLRGAR